MTDFKLEGPGGEPVSIELTGLQMAINLGTLTAWRAATFAPNWFNDALAEAKRDGPDARRREILFAVAFVESYLYEWVRNDVLKHNYAQLDSHFDSRDGMIIGIRERWKRVTKRLHEENLIRGIQDFSRSTWAEFHKLVDFRNGLLHGAASRPETTGLEQDRKSVPSPDELQSLQSGWACEVVCDLIMELHGAAGSSSPDWLCQNR